jgi:hypothetical protein
MKITSLYKWIWSNKSFCQKQVWSSLFILNAVTKFDTFFHNTAAPSSSTDMNLNWSYQNKLSIFSRQRIFVLNYYSSEINYLLHSWKINMLWNLINGWKYACKLNFSFTCVNFPLQNTLHCRHKVTLKKTLFTRFFKLKNQFDQIRLTIICQIKKFLLSILFAPVLEYLLYLQQYWTL